MDQIKNKFRALKTQWQHWKQLLGTNIGLGWNPDTGTIATDEDWWDARIKATPEVGILRNRQMPNWDDLCCMFAPCKDFSAYGRSSQPPSSQARTSVTSHDATSTAISPVSSLSHSQNMQTLSPNVAPSPRALRAKWRAAQITPSAQGTFLAQHRLDSTYTNHTSPSRLVVGQSPRHRQSSPTHRCDQSSAHHSSHNDTPPFRIVGQHGPWRLPPGMKGYAINES